MSKVIVVKGSNRERMVEKGFKALEITPYRKKVIIKPILITNRPYPVTTSPETVAGMCRGGTNKAFLDLGYSALAEKSGIKLTDLNEDDYEIRKNPAALKRKEFKFPLTLNNSFMISAVVLKRHSMAKVTLLLKNMMRASIGKKARFHFLGINKSIVDINLYKTPDLALIDGIESSSHELGGEVTRHNLMIFSEDPVAADAVGADILGLDPLSVPHIN